jgi:Na+/H+-translocating membrane pyrophosphatase
VGGRRDRIDHPFVGVDLRGVGNTPVEQTVFVLYGVALTGTGILTLTGNNVAMDSFGPISDSG